MFYCDLLLACSHKAIRIKLLDNCKTNHVSRGLNSYINGRISMPRFVGRKFGRS